MSLPGVNTQIKDRFFTLSRSNIPLGPRVGILGKRTTADGTSGVADLDPYNAFNEADVIAAFGAGSHLHRGYLEAVAGGATRVTLIALPSDTTYNHTLGTLSSSVDDVFDLAFAAVEAANIDLLVPWGRGSGATEFQSPATPGDDVEIGFHADNSSTAANSWAVKVAEKCLEITRNSHPCLAIMGIAPYVGVATSEGGMTPAAVNTHLGLTGLVSREDGLLVDAGPYLSVVAGEITPIGYNRNYDFGYANGAVTYAGHLCQLDSWSAPTGKIIFNIEKIRYNPTRTQQQNLINKAVVPIALNYTRVPTWVDALTFSKAGSDYTRLTTLRIVFDAVQMVRAVSQQFIGEASNTQTRNALETAITSGLRGMQVAGAVLDSDFTVSYIPGEYKAVVDMVLRPAFELRNIDVQIAINL